MRPSIISAAVLVFAALALAQSGNYSQSQYQPSVPSSSGGGYMGFYGGIPGGGTVEGSIEQGMASMMSAAGNYNLATSAAAVNLTQARKQDIVNRQNAVDAYFAMKETNRASRAAQQSPRLSEEQLVRLAAQAAPKPIDASELNPVTGQVAWPELLKAEVFRPERAIIDELLGRQAKYGKLSIADHQRIGDALESMSDKLRDNIREVPSAQYIDTKNFLKSLIYSVNKAQLA
jgi:hypothetical protein